VFAVEKMTKEEVKQFLLTGTRTGKLATVRKNGRSHVAPIWFDIDGEQLVFTTWHESVKAANLRRDSRVSICVDEEVPPYAFVIIEGTAAISEDSNERAYWARKIGARYMGEDQADAFGKRNSIEGELVIRVTPTKIIAQKNVAGW
jgi:PPOX class probable F420-dependent enzyme